MSEPEKEPSLRLANDNPWYCLATLHGEQPNDGFDRELAEKNCRAWNRWLGDMTEGDRAGYVPIFARRTTGRSIMLPERAGVPDFANTRFDRKVSFKNFLFSPGANFSSSAFTEDADFASATFALPADFSSTTFAKFADFHAATFSGWALFTSATFAGVAHFESTMFDDSVIFDSATFLAGVDFYSAKFVELGAFKSVRFLGDTDFSRATFTGAADFNSATFAHRIHFVNAKLAAVTQFSDARFETCVPDFRSGTLDEATEWHGVTWPVPPKTISDAQEQVYAYERLKQEMERLKKHEDEQQFFRRELRARRALLRPWSGSWLLNLIYQIFSNYGDSFGRPLAWLTGVFVAGTGIYATVPLCAGQPMPTKLAARLSFANIFVFLNDKRELLALPGMATCLSNWTAAVSAVQSISGVVLLFLLGLGLRNRFRMK